MVYEVRELKLTQNLQRIYEQFLRGEITREECKELVARDTTSRRITKRIEREGKKVEYFEIKQLPNGAGYSFKVVML